MKTKNDSPLIRVFIGYDARADPLPCPLAQHHAPCLPPVTITPLVLPHFEVLA